MMCDRDESVEGLHESIMKCVRNSWFCGEFSEKQFNGELNDLLKSITLPSVKPVMPEEMPESVIVALNDVLPFMNTETGEKMRKSVVYQAIRTALMNSGDKDKVNE